MGPGVVGERVLVSVPSPEARAPGRWDVGMVSHLYLEAPGRRADDARPLPHPEEWAALLGAERALREARGVRIHPGLTSVLVGGGAPTALGPDLPGRVREVVGTDVAPAEWTVEVEGGAATDRGELLARHAKDWVDSGVTRLCVRAEPVPDVGGWSPRRLELLGRLAEVESGVLAADLLVRPAHDSIEDLLRLVDRMVRMGVSHLSIHEDSTGGDSRRDDSSRDDWSGGRPKGEGSRESPGEDDQLARLWVQLDERVSALGFVSTDLVNRARPGAESEMARAIVRRRPILGLGPGARSFRNPRRRWNVPTWKQYRARIRAGRDPVEDGEILTRPEVRMERIWLRLQTAEGLPLPEALDLGGTRLRAWVEAGWVRVRSGRLQLTPEGLLRLDGIAVEVAERLPAPRRRASDL